MLAAERKKRQSSKGGKVASKGSGLEKKSTSCQTEPACIMRVDKRKSVSGGTKTGVNAADRSVMAAILFLVLHLWKCIIMSEKMTVR